MRHRRGRVHEQAPTARAPGERRVLVGGLGIDAERVLDARAQELAAVVQRAPTSRRGRTPPRRSRAPAPRASRCRVRANGGSRSFSPKVPSVVDCSRTCSPRDSVKRSGPRRRTRRRSPALSPTPVLRLVHLDARRRLGLGHENAEVRPGKLTQGQAKDARRERRDLDRPRLGSGAKAGRGPLDRTELGERRERRPVRLERVEHRRRDRPQRGARSS